MLTKQPSVETLRSIADALEPILRQAGEAIVRLYHLPEHAISTKSDLSPVTDADMASHHLLVDALAKITPQWPVVSEEDVVALPEQNVPYWLLDPLDGTKEFIARTGEFSINLGLVIDQQAAFGLLYGPMDQLLWRGGWGIPAEMRRGDSAWTPIRCRHRPSDGGVLISSRRSAATPDGESFSRRDHLGSALKFGRIAQGDADVYVRRGPTMEWDTCAGQAIVESAGGSVMTLSNAPLRYSKAGFLNPGFIVRGD